MLKKILTYGLIAGLLSGGPLFAITVTLRGSPPPYGVVLGYLTMLVALSFVFIAIKRQRDVQGGGVIRFWPAFGLGLGISAVAAVLYVVAWEAALAVTGVDFAAEYTKMLLAEKRAGGATDAELAELAAQMESFRVQYANPLFRLPMTFAEIFPVGLLVSLVSAALLRNPRFLPARRAPLAAGVPDAR